jgi:hypothetical protein
MPISPTRVVPKRERPQPFRLLVASFLLAALSGCTGTAAESVMTDVELVEERLTSFSVRGWGAVYLLPEPGPLEIVVEKQDLNRFAGADILVARLLGPDREELAVARFPDDGNADAGGGARPVQRVRFKTEVTRPGLYKLDLEARTGQELGHDIVWGVSTNSRKMAIESLLSFMNPGEEGNIYFYPLEPEFDVQVRGIGSHQDIRLFDHEGNLVETFDTRAESTLKKQISSPASSVRKPWGIQLEQQRASLQVEGVSHFRNDVEDFYPKFGYWSLTPDALFPVEEVRWLINPHQVVHYPDGSPSRHPFRVRNGSLSPATLSLSLQVSDGVTGRLERDETVSLEPGETAEIWISLDAPDLDLGVEKRVTLEVLSENSLLRGYSTIRLRGGPAPVQEKLALPLVLEPYRHENLLFGYRPEYVPNIPYFDRANRPFIRLRGSHRHHSRGLHVLEGEDWREADYMKAVEEAVPDLDHAWFASYRLANKVGFDADGDAYTLLSVTRKSQRDNERQALLIHTADRGRTFAAHPLGDIGDATFELEQFVGHNDDFRPPAALLYARVEDHPAQWAWLNELHLFLPVKDTEGNISPGKGILVSDRALNPAAHSGGGSALATQGDLTFVVWGEAVDPKDDAPGVPSYISVYDRASGNLATPQFLAYAPPINDSHNSPAVTLDSQGYIHVVVGAHGRSFQYLRSREPLRIDAGWTDPVNILSTGRIEIGADVPERGAQTYVGLVCTPDDTLHVVSRQWREGVDSDHDGHLYAALSYQRKRPGEGWEEPVPLVVPPLPNYSVFYHKLSIDRMGRLYLAYNYYSVHEHYRKDIPGRLNHQAVMMSADGGESWKLATTQDFIGGIEAFNGDGK